MQAETSKEIKVPFMTDLNLQTLSNNDLFLLASNAY